MEATSEKEEQGILKTDLVADEVDGCEEIIMTITTIIIPSTSTLDRYDNISLPVRPAMKKNRDFSFSLWFCC